MIRKKYTLILFLILGSFSGAALLAGCSDNKSTTDIRPANHSLKVSKRKQGRKNKPADGSLKRSADESRKKPGDGSPKKSAYGTPKKPEDGTTKVSSDGSADYSGEKQAIAFNKDWEYASYSKINTGKATLYHTKSADPKGITICVNAGHGTKNGSSQETQCHPDGSPKLISGSTEKGSTMSAAIGEGMTFPDGTPEGEATLSLALILKDKLLDAGYDVLMIRETKDVQLDNIARTVIANNYANCHIALHYDSTKSDKGAFYMSVPDISSYRQMEPVKSQWKKHHKLGNALIKGLKEEDVPIFNDGTMAMDLTQTSYSTIPSVDLEVGDSGSDISEETQSQIADGILRGIESYF